MEVLIKSLLPVSQIHPDTETNQRTYSFFFLLKTKISISHQAEEFGKALDIVQMLMFSTSPLIPNDKTVFSGTSSRT